MSQEGKVDSEIIEAILQSLRDSNLEETPYAKKFQKRIVNKLIGQFHDSDLMDLINEFPDTAQDQE